jgi:murein DD-endopeptidase MepM/ murein hydrolase activator NlpD
MKTRSALLLVLCFLAVRQASCQWLLPIGVRERRDVSILKLTAIGAFGAERRPRKGIPAHLHTGIDIRRPSANYENEKIFPVCEGVVVSIREDGAFAQVIIEHLTPEGQSWTVYEHIAALSCSLGDSVSPFIPIARFFSKKELDSLGWQFDHFHFEIMRQKPPDIAPTPLTPGRRRGTYALTCFSDSELRERYFDPIEFLRRH